MMQNNQMWIWGYVLEDVPGPMMFVDGQTECSLETAADYLGADNVVFMDSCTSRDNLNDRLFKYVAKYKQVICGLDHADYVDCARRISEFSLTHPNITGAMLDDFRELHGPSRDMTPTQLQEIHQALKSANPKLKLYVVWYHMRLDIEELIPFKDAFDGVSLWCWNSTEHFWNAIYSERDLPRFHYLLPDKEILQGQFLHAYGDAGGPQPMEQLKLQCSKIGDQLRKGVIQGWIVLQNGFFCRESHREQVQFLKGYFDWFLGTRTRRDHN